MKVWEILDSVERRAGDQNRLELLVLLNECLESLGDSGDFSFLQIHLNPLASTKTSERYYPLPADFPENFTRTINENTGEAGYSITIDDGTSNSQPKYIPPETFFLKDLSGESTGYPSEYTIAIIAGVKYLVLSPPPDSTGYTVHGTYTPASFDLQLEDEMIPGAARVARYYILHEIQPKKVKWQQDYLRARADLFLKEARSRPAQLVPDAGQYWRDNGGYY